MCERGLGNDVMDVIREFSVTNDLVAIRASGYLVDYSNKQSLRCALGANLN